MPNTKKGQMLFDSTYVRYLEQANYRDKKKKSSYQGLEGSGNGELLPTQFVWNDEKALEMETNNSCTRASPVAQPTM